MKTNIKNYRNTDVVLEEIWRIKDTLSASYGHDVHRLLRKRANVRKIAAIRSSTCRIYGTNGRRVMRDAGTPREIKPSRRQFEALLAQEEKVNA